MLEFKENRVKSKPERAGFRVMRKPIFPSKLGGLMQAAREDLPDASLFDTSGICIGIASKHETALIAKQNMLFKKMRRSEVMKRILDAAPITSRKPLTLPVIGITTKPTEEDGVDKISILLGDRRRAVREERNQVLHHLCKLAGVGVPPFQYQLDLSIGYIPSGNLENLDELDDELPTEIVFGKIAFAPTIEYVRLQEEKRAARVERPANQDSNP